jgi:succinoglycan biosynthesis transport protein ExoP
MQHAPSEPTTLGDYLRPLWSHKWMVLAIVVIATAGTYRYYESKTKQYSASTEIYLLGSVAADSSSAEPSDDRNVQNQATLLHSRAVAARVVRFLRVPIDPDRLLGAVDVEPVRGSDYIRITAKMSSPTDAARVANAFAREFQELRQARFATRVEQALAIATDQRQRATNRQDRNALDTQIRRLNLLRASGGGSDEQIDVARPSSTPVAPKPKRNAAFALVLSALFAAMAAYGLERLDRRIRRRDEVEALYRAPILADVPQVSKPAPTVKGHVAVAPRLKEAFRTLRMNIALESLDRPVRTLLVTSAMPREGKTTTVRNLALAYRQAGMRVAVVDADLRRPSLHRFLNIERDPGLTDVLTDRQPLDSALQAVTVDVRGIETLARVHTGAGGNGGGEAGAVGALLALASGPSPANPPAVLASERTRSLLHDLAETYDVVIVDCPPVLPVSDVLPLLTAVDGVLLVARLRVATTVAAARLADQLGRVPNLRVLGVVLNGVSERDTPNRRDVY